MNLTDSAAPSARTWKILLEALTITLGTLVGGMIGFLVTKMDNQISLIQRLTLVSHIYQIENPLFQLLIGDNQYYLSWLIYETILVIVLLFFLFVVFWSVKPENRPLTFRLLTIFVIIVWFVFSFETLSYATIPSRNALDIPSLNISQAERLEIDALVVSLDAFRPFAVYYDYGFRLLLSVFLLFVSSVVSTVHIQASAKARQWTYLAVSVLMFSLGIVILFYPLVESRFDYSGEFAIWEGQINITTKPFWDGVVMLLVALLSGTHIAVLLRRCLARKPHSPNT